MRNPPQHFAPSPRRSPGAFPAAGNNGSQLRRPRSHLRRPPVAGRRRLQWEGDHHGWTRPAPPGARGQGSGVRAPKPQPRVALRQPDPAVRPGCLGMGLVTSWVFWEAHRGRPGGREGLAESPRELGNLITHEDIISGSHGVVHLSLERTRVLLSNWESVGPCVTG